jgi:hypothetical protein
VKESIDSIYLTPREKEIITQVMAENCVRYGEAWFLICRVGGEQQLFEPTGETYRCWLQSVAEEAMRRMAKGATG